MASPPWITIVIGGCGFLGSHLVAALAVSHDYQTVAVLNLKTDKNRVEGVTYYDTDLTSASEILHVFTRVRPHVVFHAASTPAATSNLAFYMRVNVEGTCNLLQQASKSSVAAFIFTSSASVVHDSVSDLIEADDTAQVLYLPEQREVYSYSTAVAENLVVTSNDPIAGFLNTSLRPTRIFGEGDYTHVGRLIELARSGEARMQMGNGENFFDYIYVGNLVDAHLLAADKLFRRDASKARVDSKTFLITNDHQFRFWDFVRAIAAAAGHPVELQYIKVTPRWFGLMLAFIPEWFVRTTSFDRQRSTLLVTGARYSTLTRTYNFIKAKRTLGYRPNVSMQ